MGYYISEKYFSFCCFMVCHLYSTLCLCLRRVALSCSETHKHFCFRTILIFQGVMCCFVYCSKIRPPGYDVAGAGRGAALCIFIIRRLGSHSHSINITTLCSFVPPRHAGPPPLPRETNGMIHKLLIALSR